MVPQKIKTLQLARWIRITLIKDSFFYASQKLHIPCAPTERAQVNICEPAEIYNNFLVIYEYLPVDKDRITPLTNINAKDGIFF